MRAVQVAIKPFLLACESKSSKLVAIALISMHKLVSTNQLPSEEALAALKAMEQVLPWVHVICQERHTTRSVVLEAVQHTMHACGNADRIHWCTT